MGVKISKFVYLINETLLIYYKHALILLLSIGLIITLTKKNYKIQAAITF